jgi:hypothetical protein
MDENIEGVRPLDLAASSSIVPVCGTAFVACIDLNVGVSRVTLVQNSVEWCLVRLIDAVACRIRPRLIDDLRYLKRARRREHEDSIAHLYCRLCVAVKLSYTEAGVAVCPK